MEIHASERRISPRLQFKTPLRVRLGNSCSTEQRAESRNLSERGTYFATDTPVAVGSAVEILLKMPEQITGKPATEWRCSGHVVRLEPVDTPRGKLGVAVRFDRCEILRSKTATEPLHSSTD